MLESLTKKQKIIFFIILAIMIGVIIYYIYSNLYTNNFSFSYEENNLSSSDLVENSNDSVSNLEKSQEVSIVVYICGAVKESKVITLKENSRICDAIETVGGLTDEADLTNINLAYILEDGEKIYIPKIGEELHDTYTSNIGSSRSSKININKATQTELETIPGIGPSTALKIVTYREENGNFSQIEDIKNVSGIGEAKFDSMKDYICVK